MRLNSKSLASVFLGLVFSSLIVQAQADAAARPLSLAAAVKLAETNSLGALAGRKRVESAEASRRAGLDTLLPSLSLSTTGSYSHLPSSPALAQLATVGATLVGFPFPGTYVDTILSAQQVIFDAFATRDALSIADYQISIQKFALAQARQEAMANAAQAYFQVLEAEGLAGVAQQAVLQADKHLEVAQERLKIGAGTSAEVLQIRAQLAQAQAGLIDARSGVNLARMNLGSALNSPIGDRPLDDMPDLPVLAVSLDKDLPAGLNRRNELQEQALKGKIDQTRVSLASRALIPKVVGTMSYAERGFYEGNFTAGVGVQWNFFDSFKTQDTMAAARGDAEADAADLKAARQAVELEIRQQDQKRQAAGDRLTAMKEGLSAAEEAYRIALQRYKLGFSSLSDLIDTQTTLTQSQSTYVLATYDQRSAELRLAKALGLDLAGYLHVSGS